MKTLIIALFILTAIPLRAISINEHIVDLTNTFIAYPTYVSRSYQLKKILTNERSADIRVIVSESDLNLIEVFKKNKIGKESEGRGLLFFINSKKNEIKTYFSPKLEDYITKDKVNKIKYKTENFFQSKGRDDFLNSTLDLSISVLNKTDDIVLKKKEDRIKKEQDFVKLLLVSILFIITIIGLWHLIKKSSED